MRNKAQFIEDAYAVIAEDIYSELNVVEDAAMVMNHTLKPVYVIPEDFTTTGKDETFIFEIKPRPSTVDPEVMIDDYFYVGKGE